MGTLVGNETLTLTGSGVLADKNVADNKIVSINTLALSDGLNGGLSSNYSFDGGSQTASITPATLTYVANHTSWTSGVGGNALSGYVKGFLASDTLANSTTGVLSFTTPATIHSPVGNYAIWGQGLTAQNYNFVQAAENATALSLVANSTPDNPINPDNSTPVKLFTFSLNDSLVPLQISTSYLSNLKQIYSVSEYQVNKALININIECTGIKDFFFFDCNPIVKVKNKCNSSEQLTFSRGSLY
jgi:hypothetical protein